jgi:hypothetical protein
MHLFASMDASFPTSFNHHGSTNRSFKISLFFPISRTCSVVIANSLQLF